jgi:hypothetical protein
VSHEEPDVLPFRGVEVCVLSTGQILAEVLQVVAIALQRFVLADTGVVDFDCLSD